MHAAYDDYVETDTMSTTLLDLQAGPAVHAQREACGADVVAMNVGRGGALYSVTQNILVLPGIIHSDNEIGHNLGLNHDRGAENTCADSGNDIMAIAILRVHFARSSPMTVLLTSVPVIHCQRRLPAPECRGSSDTSYALYNGKPIGDVQ